MSDLVIVFSVIFVSTFFGGLLGYFSGRRAESDEVLLSRLTYYRNSFKDDE